MNEDRFARLRFVERVDFTHDLALFRFRADAPQAFTPGQYATLGMEPDEEGGRPLLRPYSVVSAPGTDTLEFFVERVDDGDLTPRLWALGAGDAVWMRRKIVGRFVLDERYRHHVMAATVTGVGPYVSIARAQRAALAAGTLEAPHRLLILHGGSRSDELGAYREELAALDAATDWLTYVPTVSRPWADPAWEGEVGRVGDVLRKHADAHGFAPSAAAVYACGHPGMIDNVLSMARRAGFDDDAVHEEKYFR
jgi:ferredoxin--NADP+ reductase